MGDVHASGRGDEGALAQLVLICVAAPQLACSHAWAAAYCWAARAVAVRHGGERGVGDIHHPI